jgi:hypothetical protein
MKEFNNKLEYEFNNCINKYNNKCICYNNELYNLFMIYLDDPSYLNNISYYKISNIINPSGKSMSRQEIKKEIRKILLVCHPDKNREYNADIQNFVSEITKNINSKLMN